MSDEYVIEEWGDKNLGIAEVNGAKIVVPLSSIAFPRKIDKRVNLQGLRIKNLQFDKKFPNNAHVFRADLVLGRYKVIRTQWEVTNFVVINGEINRLSHSRESSLFFPAMENIWLRRAVPVRWRVYLITVDHDGISMEKICESSDLSYLETNHPDALVAPEKTVIFQDKSISQPIGYLYSNWEEPEDDFWEGIQPSHSPTQRFINLQLYESGQWKTAQYQTWDDRFEAILTIERNIKNADRNLIARNIRHLMSNIRCGSLSLKISKTDNSKNHLVILTRNGKEVVTFNNVPSELLTKY